MHDQRRAEAEEEAAPPDSTNRSTRGPRTQPPAIPGYRLVAHERIPLNRVSLLGLLSAPLWLAAFLFLSAVLGGASHVSVRITLTGIILGLLILLLLVPLLHEAVHGIVARLLGARPSYGIGAGFAYTTFREPVRRLPYLAICLAPLLVLSALGMALLATQTGSPGLTLVFLVGNASGAVGDLWVADRLRAVSPDALIVDLADGFAWYEAERVAG